MSEIKPGDLVMIVKATACCGNPKGIGGVFRVAAVELGVMFECCFCHADMSEPVALSHKDEGIRFSELIKIDPPAEMKDEEIEKELTV